MILAAAALMITATACNKSEEPATQPQGVSFSLSFDGTTSPETRATYDQPQAYGKPTTLYTYTLTPRMEKPTAPMRPLPTQPESAPLSRPK